MSTLVLNKIVRPGRFNMKPNEWVALVCAACYGQFIVPIRTLEQIEADKDNIFCPACGQEHRTVA